ncbi:hypothetical protein JL722_9457 [Aureococcus anophagefferens]|nr:hypothetical protein JL722_9457 [Aureococcus anophagefferens]
MPRGGGGSRSRASPTQHAEKLAEKEGGTSLMNINLMDVVELASTGSLDSTSLLSHGSAEKPAVDFMDKYRLPGRRGGPAPRLAARTAADLAALFFEARGRALQKSEDQRRERARRRAELAALQQAALSVPEVEDDDAGDAASSSSLEEVAEDPRSSARPAGGKKSTLRGSKARRSRRPSAHPGGADAARPSAAAADVEADAKKAHEKSRKKDRQKKQKTWGKAAATLAEKVGVANIADHMEETEDGEFVLTDGMRARVAGLFDEMGGHAEEIGLAEFRMALIGLGLVLSEAESLDMFQAADTDEGGTLDVEEFTDVVAGVLTPFMEMKRMERSRSRPHSAGSKRSNRSRGSAGSQGKGLDGTEPPPPVEDDGGILREVLDRDAKVDAFRLNAARAFRAETARAADLLGRLRSRKRQETPGDMAHLAPAPAATNLRSSRVPRRAQPVKREPRRPPWYDYEKLRRVLRPNSSSPACPTTSETWAEADLERDQLLIQRELVARLAPATPRGWDRASKPRRDPDERPATTMSGYTQPARPRKDESPWAAPFAGMHTLQNAAAGIVGERFRRRRRRRPAASSRPPRSRTASGACSRARAARRRGGARGVSPRSVENHLAGTYAPDLRGMNARELRLMRKCVAFEEDVGVEAALRDGPARRVPRRLTGLALAPVLRAALRAKAAARRAEAADADDYAQFAGPRPSPEDADAARRDDAEEADEADDETVELVVKRMTRHHEKAQGKGQPLRAEHFYELVRRARDVFAVQPIKARLERGLCVPLDKPSPLCWANFNAPGARLVENPIPPELWRSAQSAPPGKRKKKPKAAAKEGAGEAAVAKGRGRASTGDANADTALRIRNEDIQYNQDSFEAIALRMESEQTDEGGAEAPTVY